MSTRSTLRWLDHRGNVVAQIYRHSDGYPTAVIPDLTEFFEWDTRASDPEYSAANFIYYMKVKQKELQEKIRTELDLSPPGESLEHLGYGIQNPNRVNGDVEYLYEIQFMPQGNFLTHDPEGKEVLDHIRVKVSTNMLDLNKPISFENAKWQFEGTLREAVNHIWEDD